MTDNLYTYDFKKHTATFTPIPTTGFAAVILDNLFEGSEISVEWDSDDWNESKNIGGGGTRSRSNDNAATIKFTLPKESNLNDLLLALRNADTAGALSGSVVGSFMLRNLLNNQETVYADQVWIKGMPATVVGQSTTGIEWTLRTFNAVKY